MEVDGFDSLLEPSSRLQALPSCPGSMRGPQFFMGEVYRL